ncbi:hypothetical protein U9M48_042049 [Paspalum notatum var. saurae]|uniref:Transmembrane protein n=1 Tax=Paspalum notatum var. saurae TaxID=547442 RepID=A0AAQ3UUC0_PASNO
MRKRHKKGMSAFQSFFGMRRLKRINEPSEGKEGRTGAPVAVPLLTLRVPAAGGGRAQTGRERALGARDGFVLFHVAIRLREKHSHTSEQGHQELQTYRPRCAIIVFLLFVQCANSVFHTYFYCFLYSVQTVFFTPIFIVTLVSVECRMASIEDRSRHRWVDG